MSFKSHDIDEDVMKKLRFFFIETTANILLGVQDSISRTLQNVHISFTPDNYYRYTRRKELTELCVSGLLRIFTSLI